MNREHIGRLLGEAAKLTNHREYVIIGSLSVLGTVASPPETMETDERGRAKKVFEEDRTRFANRE